MPIVNDIDRPDRGGNPPKMLAICEQVRRNLTDWSLICRLGRATILCRL